MGLHGSQAHLEAEPQHRSVTWKIAANPEHLYQVNVMALVKENSNNRHNMQSDNQHNKQISNYVKYS